MAQALTQYLNEDVAGEWGGFAVCRVATEANDGEIPCYILDDPDIANAAGYHDKDPQGRPYMRCFRSVSPTILAGPQSLMLTLSHECAETFVDPSANLWADRADGTEEALEAADRVEDSFYEVNGCSCSNFLTRNAFDPGATSGFDKLGLLQTQTAMTPGGYVIVRSTASNITPTAMGTLLTHTKQIKAEGNIVRLRIDHKRHPGSRSYRRGLRLG